MRTRTLMRRGKPLLLDGSALPTPLVWLLNDEFTTNEAAPIGSPRTSEPGPGTLTFVQTDGQYSIASNALTFPIQGTPVRGDQGWYSGAIARSPGVAMYSLMNLTTATSAQGMLLGFADATDLLIASMQATLDLTSALVWRFATDGNEHTWNSFLFTLNTNYEYVIVLRNLGAHFFHKSGADWVLDFPAIDGNSSTLYATHSNYEAAGTLDDVRAADLVANGHTVMDSGDLDQTDSSAAPAAGTTFTHTANGVLKFTITTLPSADNVDVFFRVQDATNYWRVRINAAGDFNLDEVVAGSPTNRGTAAAALAGGEIITIVFDGETITGWYDETQAWTYASAANFKTDTSGEVDALGTGGVVSTLTTRTLDTLLASTILAASRTTSDSFTHAADHINEFLTTVLPPLANLEIAFRRQDATNFWRHRIVGSSGAYRLQEIVAGGSTNRITGGSSSFSDGDRLVCIAVDETITVISNNALVGAYASAANFKTETDGDVITIGAGGQIDDIVIWPHKVGDSVAAALSAMAEETFVALAMEDGDTIALENGADLAAE